MSRFFAPVLLVSLFVLGATAFAEVKCEDAYAGSSAPKSHYLGGWDDDAPEINGEEPFHVLESDLDKRGEVADVSVNWGEVVNGTFLPEGVLDHDVIYGGIRTPLIVYPRLFEGPGATLHHRAPGDKSLSQLEIAQVFNEAARAETSDKSFNNFYVLLLKQLQPKFPQMTSDQLKQNFPATDVASFLNKQNSAFCLSTNGSPNAYLFANVHDMAVAAAHGLASDSSSGQSASDSQTDPASPSTQNSGGTGVR